MDLFVTAYKRLLEVKNPTLDMDGNPTDFNHWKLKVTQTLPDISLLGYAAPFIVNTTYEWDEAFSFHVSNSTLWLDQLVDFKGPLVYQELVTIRGKQGIIGTQIAKKLKIDFSLNLRDAILFAKNLDAALAEEFMDHYTNWTKACDIAADYGAIDIKQ